VVDNEPAVAVLHEGEAVARRQALVFPVLDVGKRVIAGVDRTGANDSRAMLRANPKIATFREDCMTRPPFRVVRSFSF
jgi:hypothetical protein